MSDLLIVLGAVVLVILSSAWWPAIGRAWWDWRFNHMLICWSCRRYIWPTLLRDQSGTPRHRRCQRKWVMPAWTGPDSPQTPVPVDDPDDDDDDPAELCSGCMDPDGLMHCDGRDSYCDCTCGWREEWATEDDQWAEQLHAINQLGKFGDLTRPIHLQTHYEVEAVIRQLAVPDWLPERLRIAA